MKLPGAADVSGTIFYGELQDLLRVTAHFLHPYESKYSLSPEQDKTAHFPGQIKCQLPKLIKTTSSKIVSEYACDNKEAL